MLGVARPQSDRRDLFHWWMAERVQVRDLGPAEGNTLLGIVRRGSGSVGRWRRAQIVLWSAQRMDVPAIATIAFTSEDRVREVIDNFNFSPHLSTKIDQRVTEWANSEQRRTRVHTDVLIVVERDRSPVPSVALLRARRHRPRRSCRASLDDAALHHLAQPPRPRRSPT